MLPQLQPILAPAQTNSVRNERYSLERVRITTPGNDSTNFNILGYWCSEGSHATDAVVSWVGTLNSKATLKGLKIRWAYSPKEVQVSVSAGTSGNEQ